MEILLKNGFVFLEDKIQKKDLLLEDNKIKEISDNIHNPQAIQKDISNYVVFPGFKDVHVHFREPGFSYKETIKTGAKAAARGGYTTVCTMPNIKPVPDSLENIKEQLDIIKRDACIKVVPYGSNTKGENGQELSDMEEIAPYVCAFSDDGKSVPDIGLFEEGMKKAKSLGKLIASHCEDLGLVNGGVINDCEFARKNGLPGICNESESVQVKREIEIAEKLGARYHICHVSTKESIEEIRAAKKRGVDVTCETAPHYLVLCDEDLQNEGKFKMNPPLRSREDREAVLNALIDGTIDCIATDHAPHSLEEKSRGLLKSPMGIVGLETAFPVMYTYLVLTGKIGLDLLVRDLTVNPGKRFDLGSGVIGVGEEADLTVIDLNEEYVIDTKDFESMGKVTPFEGYKVKGKVKMTICGGNIAWEEN